MQLRLPKLILWKSQLQSFRASFDTSKRIRLAENVQVLQLDNLKWNSYKNSIIAAMVKITSKKEYSPSIVKVRCTFDPSLYSSPLSSTSKLNFSVLSVFSWRCSLLKATNRRLPLLNLYTTIPLIDKGLLEPLKKLL